MAHLRFALVAWLSIGITDPGALLGHMNRLCAQLAITGTAVIASFDPATRSLRWARAGHMAPLLGRAGTGTELGRPPGLLLGADTDAVYPVATERLRADDLVLFYTDGLVERRAPDSDLLDRVLQQVAAASEAPDEDTLTALGRLLHHPSPHDDTCTLTVRVLPRSEGEPDPHHRAATDRGDGHLVTDPFHDGQAAAAQRVGSRHGPTEGAR
jgi:serine phosphatase RsbU (regulator of sigma subunit)